MFLRFTFVTVLSALTAVACGFPTSETETSPAEPEPAPAPNVFVAPKGPKKIFVTEGIFTGALGGFAGADVKCQTEADEAGLAGKYRAWISTIENDPFWRLGDPDAGPYVLVTGEIVASSFDGLVDGQLDHPIDRTARGVEPPMSRGQTSCGGNLVWTSTRRFGSLAGSDCKGWTSDSVEEQGSLGIAGATSSQWTDWCYGPKCNFQAHLYCVEQ